MNTPIDRNNMNRSSLKAYSTWLLKGNLIVWAVNGIIAVVLGLIGLGFDGLVSYGYFSKIAFLETGIAFLIGGAMAFSGSVLPNKAKEQIFKSPGEPWSMEKLRDSEKKANRFIVLAVILFVESIIISFLGV